MRITNPQRISYNEVILSVWWSELVLSRGRAEATKLAERVETCEYSVYVDLGERVPLLSA
jgi:hypothetical protein